MKLLELFGGIGACSAALKRLLIDVEIADYVEIDKYAVQSYNAINGTNFEPQDITKWDKDIQVDMIMHGSPCQDFSLAGLQKGGDKGSGTRSSLMYETIRIVNKLKPRYVVWENVKNLLSKKHKHNFDAYIDAMNDLNYNSYYRVLNAKNYGIPQNRERVFTISIRKDIDEGYEFPKPFELDLRLKDMLEDEVDEKYYLSEKMIKYIMADNEKWTGNNAHSLINKSVASTINTGEGSKRCDASNYVCKDLPEDFDLKKTDKLIQACTLKGGKWDKINESCRRVYDSDGLAPTIHTCQGGNTEPKVLIKNATKKGYLEAEEGDGIDISSRQNYHRGTVQKGMSQTLDTQCNVGVVVVAAAMRGRENGQQIEISDREYSNCITTIQKDSMVAKVPLKAGMDHQQGNIIYTQLRIRKLTPKECWRLMGFSDENFRKAEVIGVSNTQLYKQAGNSIVVDVLYYIFANLFHIKINDENLEIRKETNMYFNKQNKRNLKTNIIALDEFFDIEKLIDKDYPLFNELCEKYPLKKECIYILQYAHPEVKQNVSVEPKEVEDVSVEATEKALNYFEEQRVAKEDKYYYHPESESYFMIKKGEKYPDDSEMAYCDEITKEQYEFACKSDLTPQKVEEVSTEEFPEDFQPLFQVGETVSLKYSGIDEHANIQKIIYKDNAYSYDCFIEETGEVQTVTEDFLAEHEIA